MLTLKLHQAGRSLLALPLQLCLQACSRVGPSENVRLATSGPGLNEIGMDFLACKSAAAAHAGSIIRKQRKRRRWAIASKQPKMKLKMKETWAHVGIGHAQTWRQLMPAKESCCMIVVPVSSLEGSQYILRKDPTFLTSMRSITFNDAFFCFSAASIASIFSSCF